MCLMDVRPTEEYEADPIAGAVSIPLAALVKGLAELTARPSGRRLLPRDVLRARSRGGEAAPKAGSTAWRTSPASRSC